MKKEWFREFARDVIALGSPIFFLLVLVRISILSKPYFLSQFIVAGVIFFLLALIFKSDLYSGLGFIILFFTIIYYNDLKFSIFAGLAYFVLIVSLFYLKKERNNIIKGISFGVVSAVISYYLIKLVFF